MRRSDLNFICYHMLLTVVTHTQTDSYHLQPIT